MSTVTESTTSSDILAGYRDEREPASLNPIRYPSLNSSLQERAKIIQQALKSDHLYWTFKRKVKSEIAKSKYSLDDVRSNLFQFLSPSSLPPSFTPSKSKGEKNVVNQILEQEEWDIELDNEIFKLNMEASRNTRLRQKHVPSTEGIEDDDTGLVLPPIPYEEEKLSIVQEARSSWANFLKDQLVTISNQVGLCFIKPRREKVKGPTSNISEILDELSGMKITTKKPEELDDSDSPLLSSLTVKPRYTGVFDSKKLMEMCISITNPNSSELLTNAGWGQIKLEVKTPTIKDLQSMFKELDPENFQVGLDDIVDEKFSKDVLERSKKSQKNLRMVYEIAKKGVPTSMRAKIWGKILEVNMDESDITYFELLKKDVRRREFLIDHMVHNDVKKTVDDENFFVFEDVIDEMMIVFSRDPQVAESMEHPPKFVNGVDEITLVDSCEVYPPSGVIPFEGLSTLAAPICYLTNDTKGILFVEKSVHKIIL